MSRGVPEFCPLRFRSPFIAVCPQESGDRLRIQSVTGQATILTPQMVKVNFDEIASDSVALDRKYLAIDRSVPGFHSRLGRGLVELSGRNVTISRADMEAWDELLQQRLLKLVRQTVPIGIELSAVANPKCKQAEQNEAHIEHMAMPPVHANLVVENVLIRPRGPARAPSHYYKILSEVTRCAGLRERNEAERRVTAAALGTNLMGTRHPGLVPVAVQMRRSGRSLRLVPGDRAGNRAQGDMRAPLFEKSPCRGSL